VDFWSAITPLEDCKLIADSVSMTASSVAVHSSPENALNASMIGFKREA
jgi:hypothetical protein